MYPHKTVPFDLVAVASMNNNAAGHECPHSKDNSPEKVRSENKHSVYTDDINTLAGLIQNRYAVSAAKWRLLKTLSVSKYKESTANGNRIRLRVNPVITSTLLNDKKSSNGRNSVCESIQRRQGKSGKKAIDCS